MSAFRVLRRRLLRGSAALLIAGSIAAPGLSSAQQEAPTAETEIIVNVAGAQGSLEIGWTSSEITFLTNDGSNPTLNAEQASVHVSAEFSFTVDDQRPPGQTQDQPYTLYLHCPDLMSETGATIPASDLVIESVSGISSLATGTIASGTACGSTVLLYTMPAKSGKMTFTATLVIGTTLPASIEPGTYSGGFTIDQIGDAP